MGLCVLYLSEKKKKFEKEWLVSSRENGCPLDKVRGSPTDFGVYHGMGYSDTKYKSKIL